MGGPGRDRLAGHTMLRSHRRSDFPTTRWTMVLAAGGPARAECHAALFTLCETYWYPLYAYARRRGYAAEEAQELTQEFFLRILEGRYLDRADPQKGRFRSFLLTSFKFFLADEWDRSRAQKRRGVVLPFEIRSREEQYERDLAHEETPERIYERRWALSLLDRVMGLLRSEFVEQGRLEQFNRMKPFLLGEPEAPYAAVAQQLNTSEGALKVAIHRFRKRYRELVRQEVAQTVADPADVASEIRYLAAVLGGQSTRKLL
jgi:RNA polymerase sigma factor (sigma-70 family)